MEQVWTCLFIICGRIVDVTLGTMRTIAVVRGRKHLAALLGFTEVFIWIFIVAKVVEGLSENIVLGLSYAAGFAIGNYVGVTVDDWLGFGEQALLIVSRQGREMAEQLRAKGWRLTQINGEGRDGPTNLLVVVVKRWRARELQNQVEAIDSECFYTIEDVRVASSLAARKGREEK